MRGRMWVLAGALALSGCSARAGVAVEPATAVVVVGGSSEGDRVWVCHRGRWQSVAAPAAEAHRKHGDRVSRGAREARAGC